METLPEELDELPDPPYEAYRYVLSSLFPGDRILDVGCGNAKVSAYLARSGAVVDGIEPAASRMDIARERVRHLSTLPVGEDDPNLLDEYDVITFFDVLEHLSDPTPALDWSVRRLAPSGRIIAVIPNSAHWTFRRKMLRGDWRMEDSGLFDRTHLRFYDPHTMTDLLPLGTMEVARHYFTPSKRLPSAVVQRWPALLALRAVITWRRS